MLATRGANGRRGADNDHRVDYRQAKPLLRKEDQAREHDGCRQQVQRFHGVDPAVPKRVTNDGGFEWKTIGRWTDAAGRTEFKTDLDLFQAVYFSESDLDPANRWKQVDVRWQNTLSTKLMNFISFNLYLDFIYNAQIRRAGMLRETLGIGLTYDLY